MKKKILTMGLILILATLGAACGSGSNDRKNPVDIADRYTAEKIDLSIPLTIYHTAIYGNTIHFYGLELPAGFKEGDELPEDTLGLYFLDMDEDNPAIKPFDYHFAGNEYLFGMAVNPDGNIDLMISVYDERENIDTENAENTDIILRRIDQGGTELFSFSIWDDLQDEEYKYPSAFLADGNYIYVAVNESVYIWDSKTGLRHKIGIGSWIHAMTFSREGQAYVMWYDNDIGMLLAGIDAQNGTLKQNHSFGYSYYNNAAPGLSKDLLLISDRAVSEYELETRNLKEVFNYTNANILMSNNSSGRLLKLADGRLFWLVNDYSNFEGSKLWFVRPMAEGEGSVDGETLILGLVPSYFDQPIRQAVAEFNNANPEHKIEIREYGSEADFEPGINQLNIDIVNGKGPDIIVLPTRFAMGIYAQKNVLADLYPLLDNGPTVARADLQENILEAYEVDGKLMAIPLDYMLRTMVAPKSVLGDIKNWNLDEMITFVNSLRPESEVFEYPDKSSVFRICLRANGETLVDWSKSENAFDRDLYLKILNFANQFSNNVVSDSEIGRRLDEKQIQLMTTNTAGFITPQFNSLQFNEPVVYPGFPIEDGGNGHLIESRSLMAIGQDCRDKDLAWSFISSMLKEDFQVSIAGMGSDFPIRKSAMERMIAEVMEPTYYTDDNGLVQEQVKGSIMSSTGHTMDYYAAREEDVAVLRELLASANRIRSFDDQIDNILSEEAQTFFSGAKSAEEAADIAASRVGIYVNEMK